MRFSDSPDVQAFLEVWDATPADDRKQIPLELIALKAGVDIPKLIGAYVLCFRTLQAQKSAIRAMAAHPKVVSKTIEIALEDDGYSDRKMLHEAVGFAPTAKGLTINQSFVGQQQVEEEPDTEKASGIVTSPDIDDIFPAVNSKEESWQNNRTKLLEETN